MSTLTATEPVHSPTFTNNGKAQTMTKTSHKTYTKEPKNATALNQLGGWLRAIGAPVKPSSQNGCDLVMVTKDGRDIEIKVGTGANDPRPAVEHLFVLAKEITHRRREIALAAFHSLTEPAGYGSPKPIDRGVELEKKAYFEDHFELVAMRHAEFRKVPNPTREELAWAEPVIGKAVSRFVYINTKICHRHGLSFDDLKTYAQIWTCNYLGLYRVANPTNNDNERKLFTHLCQRFSNFIEVLLKKERNCVPDPQVACMAVLGRPYDGANTKLSRRDGQSSKFQMDDDISFEEAQEVMANEEVDAGIEADIGIDMVDEASSLEDEEREQRLSDNARRNAAQETLRNELGKLSHERLVSLLEEARDNTYLCHDARVEARKQLRVHRESCPSCLKVQEQAAGGK